MRELTYDDFKDIEGDPSWSSLDYLAVVAAKALAIYEQEEEEKKAKEKQLNFQVESFRRKQCCIHKPNYMPCLPSVEKRPAAHEALASTTSENCNMKSPPLKRAKKEERRAKEKPLMLSQVEKGPIDHETLAGTHSRKIRRISKGNRGVKGRPQRRQPEEPTPPLPEAFRNYIDALAAGEPRPEVILVIQKRFYDTDLSLHHDRLSLPCNQLANQFLSEDEEVHLSGRDEDNHVNTLSVPMIYELSPDGNATVKLRRWDMRKENGKTSVSYIITSWKHVVLKSTFATNMAVQLWAFRLAGQLRFALVKVSEEEISRMKAAAA